MLKRENKVRFTSAPEDWAKKPTSLKQKTGDASFPRGFLTSAVNAGLKKNGEPDVALLVSESPAVAAGCFTTNKAQAAPVRICRRNISNPIQAVLVNSKCANSYTGLQGEKDALGLLADLGKWFNLPAERFLIASTGVIGERLPLAKLKAALPRLIEGIGSGKAERAIMTTDTLPKTVACSLRIGKTEIRLGAMAKGAGMIAPNMATMLAFVTTDAVIARNVLQKALDAAVKESFNRVTVDGDTSTNDTVLVLANSQAGNVPIGNNTASFKAFSDALAWVLKQLAWKVVSDGEGVTKVFRVVVQGAANGSDAEKVCRAVACSPLVKTAVFGEDFNWGRIVNAAGYSGASFDADRLDISFDSVPVIVKGRPVPKNFGRAEKVFRKDRFDVRIGLNAGRAESYVFTTDFSYDYVRINADYRS